MPKQLRQFRFCLLAGCGKDVTELKTPEGLPIKKKYFCCDEHRIQYKKEFGAAYYQLNKQYLNKKKQEWRIINRLCKDCHGTGKITVEYQNQEGNDMEQHEQICECQLNK